MKYQEPFGAAEDANYVDENPATGTNGSIVPASAIEHPQREIVDLITAAGLTPSDANLTQMKQAIDVLIANAISAIPPVDTGEWEDVVSFDLTGLSNIVVDDTYLTNTSRDYKFTFVDCIASSAGAIMQVNASDDNGATFIGGRQTGHKTNSNTSVLTAINNNNSNGAGTYAPRINNDGLSNVGKRLYAEYILQNRTVSDVHFGGCSSFTPDGTSQINHEYMTALFQNASNPIDAMKISLTAGTWTAGKLEIRGRKVI